MKAALIGALLLCGWLAPAAAMAASDPAIERLERAVAAHAQDPDLTRALARAYVATDREVEAARLLRAFAKRHPAAKAKLAATLGSALYEMSQYADARIVLEEAIAAQPADATAHFFLGLVLWRLGDADAADRSLARASELEPKVTASATEARGLVALERGDHERAGALLGRDAGGSAAKGAPFRVFAMGGIEFDSNVTLDSGLALAAPGSDQDDFLYRYGGGFAWDFWRRKDLQLSFGARTDHSHHDELELLDLASHRSWLSSDFRLGERVGLRLTGSGALHELDGEGYLRTLRLQPELWIRIDETLGSVRLIAGAERQSFEQDAILPSLERDGMLWSASVEHWWPIPWIQDAALIWGAGYGRNSTDGQRDLFGLGAAYDRTSGDAHLRLVAPLFWKMRLDARAGFSRELYDHRNVIDLLTDSGRGDLTPDRRQDNVVDLSARLTRPIRDGIEAEIWVRRIHRISNVDLYDYERSLVGFAVTVRTD